MTAANGSSPYPGPRPFEPGEQASFFGRESEVADLTSLVIAHRVVLIYAQSGSGKTSLLNAGLIPSLKQEGFVVLPTVRVRGLVPDHLLAQTANVFVANTLMCWSDDASNPGRRLSASIPEFLKTRLHPVDEEGFSTPYVIVFDQFEELFAFHPERWSDREGFIRQIGQALQDDPLLHAVFVMREDYVASLDPYAHLLPRRFDTRYRIERLRPHAAREAAEGPLEQTARKFAPKVAEALVDQLLAIRVEDQAGRTVETKGEFVEPVQLQIAFESLWNELPADVTVITAEHLRAFSDVNLALGDFYEETLHRTAAETGVSEEALREWFDTRLITPAGTRGTVFRGPETTEGIPNRAVDLLENGHLIRAEMRAGGRWYELTHDRFIRPIQASNDAWQRRAHEDRIRGQMRAAVGKNMLKAAGVAVVLAAIWLVSTQVRAVQYAKARELVALALVPSIDPQESLCLALDAARSAGRADVPRVETALRYAIRESHVLDVFDHGEPILTTTFGPEGRWFVVTEDDGNTVGVRDRDTNHVNALPGHSYELAGAVFGRDGELIATTTLDGTVRVSRATGEPIFELREDGYFLTQPQFSRDGKLLLTLSSDNTIWIWNVSARDRVAVLPGHDEPTTAAAFSPDGTRVVSASVDKTARIWDVTSGEQIGELVGHREPLTDVQFSPDGMTVLTTSEDTTARVWDPVYGRTLAELRGHQGPVYSAAFSADGATIVTAGDDGTARTWIAATGAPIAILRGHKGAVTTVAFSPDGRRVATASTDATARTWDVSEGRIAKLPPHEGVRRISFTNDSRYVITIADEGGVQVADARTGEPGSVSLADDSVARMTKSEFDDPSIELEGAGPAVLLSSSLNGRTLLAAAGSIAGLVNAASSARPTLFEGHTGWVTSAAFAPDGTRIATASTDQTVRVWPVSGQGSPVVLRHPDGVSTVAFPEGPATSASMGTLGNLVLTTSPHGAVRVWDVNAARTIMELRSASGVVAAFSPDGTLVATARPDGAVETYACETCVPLEALRRLAAARVMTGPCKADLTVRTP